MTERRSLTKRESEVMEILHRLGRATAAEVRAELADRPSDAAVRWVLRTLVDKELAVFHQSGPRYVYAPRASARTARTEAVHRLLTTFFAGSVEGAMAALLEQSGPLTPEARRQLKALIDRAEREGR